MDTPGPAGRTAARRALRRPPDRRGTARAGPSPACAVSAAKRSAIRASSMPSAPVIERVPGRQAPGGFAREQRRAVDGTGQVGEAVLDGLEGTDRHPELLALLDPARSRRRATTRTGRRATRRRRSAIRVGALERHRGRRGRSPARPRSPAAQIAIGDGQIPLIRQRLLGAARSARRRARRGRRPMTRSATAPAGTTSALPSVTRGAIVAMRSPATAASRSRWPGCNAARAAGRRPRAR